MIHNFLLQHQCVLPKCSAELCPHFGDFSITCDVTDLQASFVVSDQVQSCVDVHPFSGCVDVPCVIAEAQQNHIKSSSMSIYKIFLTSKFVNSLDKYQCVGPHTVE